ncbi:MAG: class I SAM-dependent methyltransferase [Planctomycetia bacterium]|nr:class I SAM-dependent methyltransferase [Planctomycetia bacterium]
MSDTLFSSWYIELAAAYVRGAAIRAAQNGGKIDLGATEGGTIEISLPDMLVNEHLELLEEDQFEEILRRGKEAGLKLYRFKNSHDTLPRVRSVLGFLQGVEIKSLLDVGSGRGVFLWPFLNLFPGVSVTSLDILPQRVQLCDLVRLGGLDRLEGMVGDICQLDLPDKSFDAITLLEVLEHIPDVESAVRNAMRLARKYIIVSVPSKPDDNPEHIHLFTQAQLAELFRKAGACSTHFGGVTNHMLLFVSLRD